MPRLQNEDGVSLEEPKGHKADKGAVVCKKCADSEVRDAKRRRTRDSFPSTPRVTHPSPLSSPLVAAARKRSYACPGCKTKTASCWRSSKEHKADKGAVICQVCAWSERKYPKEMATSG